ncbi:hypothetical protein NEMBOFW57_005189 [Staphylotrichum longicolle]|uniref:Uncharacterized protein n=1 Tax=Staphylotrichum longicolle TaxID=669026 RepID=A0AAD4EX90_9PEZI|nr:hypothetical protein NEMBOFW57_005189 [Staphylotrichum longicolle]
MYLIGRSQSVDLVDLDTSTITSLTRPQRHGLTSLTLSYISAETGDLVVHTYVRDTENDKSYPPSPIEPGPHSPWNQTTQTTRRVTNPGAYEVLPTGSIVGVRQKQTPAPSTSASPTSTPKPAFGLRRRTITPPTEANSRPSLTPPAWEAWVLNLRPDAKSDFETLPLETDGRDLRHLMISELGPMTRLGTMSVAVGFGDVVKVVSVGHEYFDDTAQNGSLGMGLGLGLEALQLQQVMGVASRRKKVSGQAGKSGGATGRGSAG